MKTKFLIVPSNPEYGLNVYLFEDAWGDHNSVDDAKNALKSVIENNPALNFEDFKIIRIDYKLEYVA